MLELEAIISEGLTRSVHPLNGLPIHRRNKCIQHLRASGGTAGYREDVRTVTVGALEGKRPGLGRWKVLTGTRRMQI
jgi:hypothetical protein